MNSIDPFERTTEPAIRREILWLNIDAKKYCADSAALQPRNIGLVIAMFFSELIPFIDNVAGCIDVAVKNQQVAQERFEPLLLCLRVRGPSCRQTQGCACQDFPMREFSFEPEKRTTPAIPSQARPSGRPGNWRS